MSNLTQSEALFEHFCRLNSLEWQRVIAGPTSSPDYRLRFDDCFVAFEIKQLDNPAGFSPFGVSTRQLGQHIRSKINEARQQLKAASQAREPGVLLIYNAADPLQMFGTEEHDFLCAMYGELTVTISPSHASDFYHGKNAKLRHNANTYFSGVGLIRRGGNQPPQVTIYENAYASTPLPFDALPECIRVLRVNVSITA